MTDGRGRTRLCPLLGGFPETLRVRLRKKKGLDSFQPISRAADRGGTNERARERLGRVEEGISRPPPHREICGSALGEAAE